MFAPLPTRPVGISLFAKGTEAPAAPRRGLSARPKKKESAELSTPKPRRSRKDPREKAPCDEQSEALRKLTRADKWEKALYMLTQSDYSGKDVNAAAMDHSFVSAACTRAEAWTQVLDVLERMNELKLPTSSRDFSAGVGAAENFGIEALMKVMTFARPRPLLEWDYVTGACACGRLSAWEHAVELITESIEEGVELSQGAAYEEGLIACGHLGKWETALHILDQALPHVSVNKLRLMNAARGACLKAGKWEEVLRISCEGKDERPDTAWYDVTMAALGRLERWPQALSLLEEMQSTKVQPSVSIFNAAIAASRPAGLDVAMKLFKDLSSAGLDPDEATYGELISVAGSNKLWERGLALLQEFLSKPGLTPTVHVFNSAIGACESCAEFETAVKILRLMPQHGLSPDVGSFNAAIGACKNAEEFVWACSLIEDMKKQGVSPDAHSYGLLITALQEGGQWERTLHLLREMNEKGIEPTASIYGAVVDACKDAGQKDWVDYVLNEMERKGIDTSEYKEDEVQAPQVETPQVDQSREMTAEELQAESIRARLHAQTLHVDPEAARQTITSESKTPEERKQNMQTFMEQLHGASSLFREAMGEGAFSPWIRENRLLDLHDMNLEVAKVAVYTALQGVPALKPDDLAFKLGLKIITGRGLHSDGGVMVVGPAVQAMVSQDFELTTTNLNLEQGMFRIPAEELMIIHQEGTFPPAWLKNGEGRPNRPDIKMSAAGLKLRRSERKR
eukprot:TRINITY_DN50174_c0_g1_i1.p1 TRINITY_DN50174_c0_g1~~TRINITY_DN50174_c0_g1_i1.p1  ORF type:complete len:769 (+),score=153.94 TRINITY_DN50174_c0_g1_i1:91-2307(+)